MVKDINPDSLIIAVGSEPVIPSIPGVNKEHVITAVKAIYNSELIGNKIVIIGGGSIGCELGLEYSLLKEHDVSIIEMTSELAAGGNDLYRIGLRQKMDKADTLTRLTETKCQEITEDGVIVEEKGSNERFIEADTVI